MGERLALSQYFEPTQFRDLNRGGFLRRQEFNANKINRRLYLLKKCSDARVHCMLPAEDTAHFTSIAAADPLGFTHAYSYPGYSFIVDYTHFGGGGKKIPPLGCGGFAEWQKLQDLQHTGKLEGAASYVWDEIKTADPLLASFHDAMAIATATDKPIFFGSLDHLTAQLYISGLAVNLSGSAQYFSPIDFNYYDPRNAYQDGYPITLRPEQLQNAQWARELERIIAQNARIQAELFATNPGFTASQMIQNPGLIFLTDLPHSLRLIIPGIAEVPNSDFAVRISKTKKIGSGVIPDPTKAIKQLEYPIAHSVKAQDEGKGPFKDTKHLFITTETIEMSRETARMACNQPYMRPWLDRGGKIMVAGVKKGIIEKPTDIAFYRP